MGYSISDVDETDREFLDRLYDEDLERKHYEEQERRYYEQLELRQYQEGLLSRQDWEYIGGIDKGETQ